MRLKADLTLLFVSFIWGTGFITQGIAAQHQLAFLFNAASFLLAALVLLPSLLKQQAIPRDQWLWMALAGLALFSASALQQVGLFYTQVSNAGFLTSLYTLFTPILLWLFFREKPRGLVLLAVIGASLGSYLLSTSGNYQARLGDALELLGAVFWGLHVLILGKYGARFNSRSFACGHFIISGLLSLLPGLFLENGSHLLVTPVWAALVYRALVSIGLGYTLQVWSQRHTPPTDAALILSLEAVFAALAGWLILEQTLLPVQVVGCLLIFVSVLVAQLRVRQPA